MPSTKPLAALDQEIARLQRARDLIASTDQPRKRRSRPPASTNGTIASPVRDKRTLSPAAWARIVAAQKRRWAKQKAANAASRQAFDADAIAFGSLPIRNVAPRLGRSGGDCIRMPTEVVLHSVRRRR